MSDTEVLLNPKHWTSIGGLSSVSPSKICACGWKHHIFCILTKTSFFGANWRKIMILSISTKTSYFCAHGGKHHYFCAYGEHHIFVHMDEKIIIFVCKLTRTSSLMCIWRKTSWFCAYGREHHFFVHMDENIITFVHMEENIIFLCILTKNHDFVHIDENITSSCTWRTTSYFGANWREHHYFVHMDKTSCHSLALALSSLAPSSSAPPDPDLPLCQCLDMTQQHHKCLLVGLGSVCSAPHLYLGISN